MSPISKLTLLAFVASALAVPGYRDYTHTHHKSSTSTTKSTTKLTSTLHTTVTVSAASSSSTVEVDAVVAPKKKTSTKNVAVIVGTTSSGSTTSPSTTLVTTTSKSTTKTTTSSSKTTTSSSKTTTASTTKSAAAAAVSTASSSSSSSGKRGLAYNDPTLTSCFTTSSLSCYVGANQVSWAYNWAQTPGSGLATNVEFIPMLWGTDSSFTSVWSANANAAIKAGAKHLFSFNEPDLSSQSNLSPAAAAAAYKTYMQPFAGTGVKLGAPAVTNGGGAMGLTWLANFLDLCTGCQIDFVNIHWYDSYTNIGYFKNQIANATAVAGGLPVFLSEFGTVDGTDANIAGFLETVMPWMDSQSYMIGYAYFMVANGKLVSGTTPSDYGTTFATYT